MLQILSGPRFLLVPLTGCLVTFFKGHGVAPVGALFVLATFYVPPLLAVLAWLAMLATLAALASNRTNQFLVRLRWMTIVFFVCTRAIGIWVPEAWVLTVVSNVPFAGVLYLVMRVRKPRQTHTHDRRPGVCVSAGPPPPGRRNAPARSVDRPNSTAESTRDVFSADRFDPPRDDERQRNLLSQGLQS